MALLNSQDVRNLAPSESLTDDQIAVAMRLVAGWLKTAAGMPALPDALADDDPLFPPALELVLLLVNNPMSLTSKTSGPTSQYWPLASRRDEILMQVRRMTLLQPKGDFPCPARYPDPAYGVNPWWNQAIDRPTS